MKAHFDEQILNIPLTDFSKPVLLQDENHVNSSDEDDGFIDILPEMTSDPKQEEVDYDEYKKFYAEEIDGKMH